MNTTTKTIPQLEDELQTIDSVIASERKDEQRGGTRFSRIPGLLAERDQLVHAIQLAREPQDQALVMAQAIVALRTHDPIAIARYIRDTLAAERADVLERMQHLQAEYDVAWREARQLGEVREELERLRAAPSGWTPKIVQGPAKSVFYGGNTNEHLNRPVVLLYADEYEQLRTMRAAPVGLLDDETILQIFADHAGHSDAGDHGGYCIVREAHALAIAKALLAASNAAPTAHASAPGADVAEDRQYIAGLKAGWNFAQSGDEDGYQRSVDGRMREILEAKNAPAPAAQEPVPADLTIRIVHRDGEVLEPEPIAVSRRFDELPPNAVVSLYLEPPAAEQPGDRPMCHACFAENVRPDHFDSAGKCKVMQYAAEQPDTKAARDLLAERPARKAWMPACKPAPIWSTPMTSTGLSGASTTPKPRRWPR